MKTEAAAAPTRKAERPRVARLIGGILLLAALLVFGAFGLSLWQIWADLLADRRRDSALAAQLLEEHALKIIGAAEMTLDHAGNMVATFGWNGLEQFSDIRSHLLLTRQPEHESVWLADAAGQVRLQTLFDEPVQLDVRDREWFAVPAGGKAELHIGRLAVGRISGKPFLPLSKRIEQEGRFLGVAQLSLNPAYFAQFYRRLAAGGRTAVQLVHADGSGIARVPEASDPTAVRNPSFARAFAAAPAGGVFRHVSDVDGVERLTTYRRVGDYPLYVTFGVAMGDLRQSWRRRALADASSTFAATLVLLALAGMAYRKAAEAEALNRSLEERVAARTKALAESERRFQDIAANFPGVIFRRVAYPDGRSEYPYVSDAAERLFGIAPEAAAGGGLEALARPSEPEERARMEAAIAAAAAALEPATLEGRLRAADGRIRWVRTIARPHRRADGATVWDGIMLDITAQREAEERQRLLMGELDHRAKNILTVVQAVIRMSRAEDIESFKEAVDGRIAALATAHTLLSGNRWEGADLGQLAEQELSPYRTTAERIRLEGPPVTLKPAAAQALGIALHELATNATKYGALAAPAGRVTLCWAIAEGALALVWTERGGPPAAAPQRRGFGLPVIKGSVEHQLEGRIELAWEAEGLVCRIRLPLERISGAGDQAPSS